MTLDDWRKQSTEELFSELLNLGSFAIDQTMKGDGYTAAFFPREGEDFQIGFPPDAELHDILVRLAFEAHQ